MKICFRRPGPPSGDRADWHEYVYWPAGLRIPQAGEMVDLDHGQFTVESVQWFTEALDVGGYPNKPTRQWCSVQVILR